MQAVVGCSAFSYHWDRGYSNEAAGSARVTEFFFATAVPTVIPQGNTGNGGKLKSYPFALEVFMQFQICWLDVHSGDPYWTLWIDQVRHTVEEREKVKIKAKQTNKNMDLAFQLLIMIFYFYLWSTAGIAVSVNIITRVCLCLSVTQVAPLFKIILRVSAHSQHKQKSELVFSPKNKPFLPP